MRLNYLLLVLSAVFLFSSYSYADAPLKQSLGLSMDQAKIVYDIQKKYRRPFAAKRGELHREERKARRARKANDSATLAQQEVITAKLRQQLGQIRHKENDEIRRVLTPSQRDKFEGVLQQRQAMVGSSRDVKEF